MKKLLRFVFVLLVLAAGGGFAFLHLKGGELITKRDRRLNEGTPEDLELDYDNLVLIGQNDLELKGYWTLTKEEPKAVVILVHGIGGNKEQMMNKADLLAQQGYDAILFDGRGHGESQGEHITYGFYEKEDIKRIVDFIKEENDSIPIGIWGNSMGGAIALQALEADERINFGIVESTFRSLDEVVFEYGKRMAKGVMIKQISDYALKRAAEEANFDPTAVQPIESAKEIEQAVLIAHGDSDKRISVDNAQDLFDSLKTEKKELVIVPRAGHLNMMEVGGEGFKSLVMDFVNSQVEALKE
ncbi:alpha/beta hydrolase [Aureicoccus marinus]|uniref:Serine aminopeptidase S33 domain-containing protein n=1 Tax=Aureicoccus marinus TaxID=754435 RepID=A0A2S7T6T9_9FLAO|nr:alpha/beta fold hydrolase [Aureicoccus marinus]PQJ15166.1 hypothetical protein BST99_04970 [Aureicoccus marinus]